MTAVFHEHVRPCRVRRGRRIMITTITLGSAFGLSRRAGGTGRGGRAGRRPGRLGGGTAAAAAPAAAQPRAARRPRRGPHYAEYAGNRSTEYYTVYSTP